MPKLSKKLHEYSDYSERRNDLEKTLEINLDSIGNSFADQDNLPNVHCENLIGSISVPVGIAGPLHYKSGNFEKELYIPLATSEGALIASVSRGVKVLNESGGVITRASRKGTTRGPVFETGSIDHSQKFNSWVENNYHKIKETAESTSRHLKLLDLDVKIISSLVFIRFYYDTGDAMGMNMVTIATQEVVNFIEKEVGFVSCLALSGNFCVDKKPSWQNFINGRGFEAWSEAVIPKKVIENTLKITSDSLYDTWMAKCMYGSITSGSLGFNAHYANIVAAFFAATGQDLAQVVEGSQGIVSMKQIKTGDIYISAYMPSVMLATVGGGTKLTTQKQALSILGLSKSSDLAEVLTGAVLAGEISLLASLAKGTLASSHASLGRTKK
jgi:hydroxymethylglutaryl-CoA reductase (NADPH)